MALLAQCIVATGYLANIVLATSSHSNQAFLSQGPAAGSSGCGKQHDSGYQDESQANTISSGDLDRTFGIYIPKGYNDDPNRPRKLIVDYHGNTGSPKQQFMNSQYFANTTGEQYITVYPAGIDQSWQSAPYATPGVDDLQFTTDLLTYLRGEYCIDDDHIYASGKSNGGGFVDYLACSSNGDEFAAFAMASAALYSDNSVDQCSGNYPRAILESHGGRDGVIWYTGRQENRGILPNIRSWVSWWAQRDKCVNLTTSGDLGGYEVLSYSSPQFDSIVQHYDVYNLGHCWPISEGKNTDSRRTNCTTDRSLEYTSVVLGFFDRWDLQQFKNQRQ